MVAVLILFLSLFGSVTPDICEEIRPILEESVEDGLFTESEIRAIIKRCEKTK